MDLLPLGHTPRQTPLTTAYPRTLSFVQDLHGSGGRLLRLLLLLRPASQRFLVEAQVAVCHGSWGESLDGLASACARVDPVGCRQQLGEFVLAVGEQACVSMLDKFRHATAGEGNHRCAER